MIIKIKVTQNLKLKIISGIILVFLVMSFSGCVNAYREVEYKKFGFVSCTIELKVQEELLLMADLDKDELFKDYTKGVDGIMKTQSTQEIIDGKKWYGVGGNITIPRKISGDYIDGMFGDYATATITETGFIYKTIQIDVSSSLNKITQTPEEGLEKYLANIERSKIFDDFAIKVPYEIVYTNGLLDANDNTRAIWDMTDLDAGITNSMTMTLSYINWTPIIIGIIALGLIFVLISIIAIIIIIRIIKKRDRKAKASSFASKPHDLTMQQNYSNSQSGNHLQNHYIIQNVQESVQEEKKESITSDNVELARENNLESNSEKIVEEMELSDPVQDILNKYGSGGSVYR